MKATWKQIRSVLRLIKVVEDNDYDWSKRFDAVGIVPDWSVSKTLSRVRGTFVTTYSIFSAWQSSGSAEPEFSGPHSNVIPYLAKSGWVEDAKEWVVSAEDARPQNLNRLREQFPTAFTRESTQ